MADIPRVFAEEGNEINQDGERKREEQRMVKNTVPPQDRGLLRGVQAIRWKLYETDTEGARKGSSAESLAAWMRRTRPREECCQSEKNQGNALPQQVWREELMLSASMAPARDLEVSRVPKRTKREGCFGEASYLIGALCKCSKLSCNALLPRPAELERPASRYCALPPYTPALKCTCSFLAVPRRTAQDLCTHGLPQVSCSFGHLQRACLPVCLRGSGGH